MEGTTAKAAPSNGAHCSMRGPRLRRDRDAGARIVVKHAPRTAEARASEIRLRRRFGGRHKLSGTGRGSGEGGGVGRLWPLLVGLPLIAAIAVAAILLSGGGDGTSTAAPDDRKQGSGGGGAEVAELGTPALGSKNAPVVLTEYGDYQ